MPLKNIHPLLGKPLLVHLVSVLEQVPYVDRAVVSTDHPEIASVARAAGLDVPFLRPTELAGDYVGDYETLDHALRETERITGTRYDIVLMLQPTSPLRRPAHVKGAVEKLVDEGWDAVWTVSRTDRKYHPAKQLTVDDGSRMQPYEKPLRIVTRQELSDVYHRNGAAYAFTRECLMEQQAIFGRSTGALIIDEPMVSIDTLEDFEKVGELLRAREP